MVFKNEFSWSKSRDALFRQCPHRYWFNHYGSWNGWIASEEDRVKRIYYLKKLKTKEVWVGSKVHEVVEFILKKWRAGEEVRLSRALAILRAKMDSDIEISKLKEYTGFASKAHRFFEDEYDISISAEEKTGLIKQAEKCVENFFNSDIFMDIRRAPVSDWVTLEDFLSFDFEGVRVFLSIDFAMWQNGKLVLYDWKTGRERLADFDLQLSLYALYIAETLGVDADKIEACIFNLAIDKVDSFDIDLVKLDDMKRYIRDSVKEMRVLLDDVDANFASEGKFEKQKGYWCNRCNFRKVCLGDWI